MARIPRDVVDAVRDRVDIAEVVGRHVKLVRRGNSLVGLCPFHQEKTPSFNVIPSKAIFHCFGCQNGGDVFRFLMQIEGLSFVEAVKELAESVGIEVPEREMSPNERQALRKRATLYETLEAAAAFFEQQLWTRAEGEPARRYLTDRGMLPETQRGARLGFAPDGWSHLCEHLQRKGFSLNHSLEAGLVRKRQRGDGHYDTFRNRIIIPILDERGRVIAFGGRLLDGEGPKYINSPESPLYNKSQTLYGLQMARRGISQRDRVILTEGYFDVLSMHQAGFTEAVATCGTALTPEHMERIRRLTRNAIVLFDADEAGSKAAERTLPMLIDAGLQAWRLQLPDAKDPDDLLRERGAEGMEEALQAKKPLVEWVVYRRLAAFGRDAMGRERAAESLVPLLAQLPDIVISNTARHLGLREEVLRARVAAHVPSQREAGPVVPELRGWKPHRDVVHLMWLLVHHYDRVADLMARAPPSLLDAHPPVKGVIAQLISQEPVASILDTVEDAMVHRTLLKVVARTTLYSESEAPLALCQVLIRLDQPATLSRLAEAERQIDDAARSNDLDALSVAARARVALVERKSAINRFITSKDYASVLTLLAKADS